MEIGLREWLIIGGAAVILLIVFDGWRRMRGARSRLRMDIEKPPADIPVDDDEGHYNPELPNGGARRVVDGDPVSAVVPPSITPETDAVAVVADADSVSPSLQTEADAPIDEGRTEPTFSVESLTLEETVAEQAAVDAGVTLVEQPEPEVVEAEQVSSVEAVSIEVTEATEASVEDSADHVVVEEDIMSSAALFEAIDFSRKQRVSDLEFELENETPDLDAVAADTPVAEPPRVEVVAESSETPVLTTEPVDIEPEPLSDVLGSAETPDVESDEQVDSARKADPLLRPMDSVIDEVDQTIAAEEVDAEALQPIVSEGPVSDDPLMAGVDEAVLDGEPVSEHDMSDVASPVEQETSEVARVEPGVSLLDGLSARDESDFVINQEPVTEEVTEEPQQTAAFSPVPSADSDVAEKASEQPLFISELAEREFNKGRETEPSFDFDDTELELPGEFAPIQKKPAVVVSLDNARSPSADDVVRTEPAEVASTEKPVEVQSDEKTEEIPASEDVAEFSESQEELVAGADEAEVDSDLTVQGGSLRQQPDPENVLVMTVISQDPHGFNGGALLQLVLACGMRFGEMDIFHRFEDGIDSGAVQFSMANATGNGVFDVNNMDAIHTRAVSFFMSMEEPREVMNAFECMLATAETLARHLNGELVDDNRILMRPQTQEHYRQRVRDFEMRNLRRRSG